MLAADKAVCEGAVLGQLVALLSSLTPNALSLNLRDSKSLSCWLQLGFALIICVGTISELRLTNYAKSNELRQLAM
jgi:hypothetical protein